MNTLIRINLLPEKKGIKIPQIPLIPIIGIAIIGIMYFYLFKHELPRLDEDKKVLETKVNKLKSLKKQEIANKERERDEITSQINEYKRKINLVRSIVTGDDVVAWAKIFEAFSDVTSFSKGNGVWLTRINVNSDYRANISGVAENDWSVLSNFIDKLKANESFSEVNLASGSKSAMDDGQKNVSVYHFEITCRIKKEKM
ncbi:MAG: PilN domain-containing protein [Candidatus Muirbacterium halophilum]|nr:PilN domain-containing protein [Candidatus Muirbacterium halophilum]MCK9475085.1 PilN domain-containing protein [Candidatus Muirbacterium halophilum]